MAESYQIYLNSKYANSYYNNTYKFSLNTLEIDEGHYIYLSVVHVSIPYSFYNVHENNNRLEYICNSSIIIIITISYMLIKANTLAVLTSNPPIEASESKS